MSHPLYPFQREEKHCVHEVIEDFADGKMTLAEASLCIQGIKENFQTRRDLLFPGWQSIYEEACRTWIEGERTKK